MTWYAKHDDSWTEEPSPPPAAFSIQVHAEEAQSPEVRFLENRHEFFHLTGVAPRPATDTTHTVAAIDFEGGEGHLLFAIHAEDNNLTFEDLRSPDPRAAHSADRLDRVQSSLNEILIPVYIDDVINDFSEGRDGLVTLHTAQYEGNDSSTWTYFRTSTFEDGDLVLEEEHGAI